MSHKVVNVYKIVRVAVPGISSSRISRILDFFLGSLILKNFLHLTIVRMGNTYEEKLLAGKLGHLFPLSRFSDESLAASTWTRNLLAEGIEANPGPQLTVENFITALKTEMGPAWSTQLLPIVDEFLNRCAMFGTLSFDRAQQILDAPNCEGLTGLSYFIADFKVTWFTSNITKRELSGELENLRFMLLQLLVRISSP
jgi:hypothetical protein